MKAMKKSKNEIKNRILAFSKKHRSQEQISPTEVTKNLFTDVWRDHVDGVRKVAGELQNARLVKITKGGKKIALDDSGNSLRLSSFTNDD
ncbi:MAG: hypothetical protein CL666_02465 [Balneola sp.]|nr:hypothetical protein [Balneola sp.]